MAFYLAVKEIWRSRGRYLLIAMIVALITTLVLFIAALSEGLASANREYIEKLNGELLVFQEGTELSTTASRIGRSRISALRRVEGVEAVGQVGFASAKVPNPDGSGDEVDVALIGVEPDSPGKPDVIEGQQFDRERSDNVIVDTGVTERLGLGVGDQLRIKVTQGTEEEFYDLNIVGITDRRQYFFQPAVFVPLLTWDKIKPQGAENSQQGELVSNIAVVKLQDPADLEAMATKLEQEVDKVEVVDRKTAWEAIPGYAAQQSTLDTQRYFTFFIGILVVGGFFQIQTLQKVAQIGMLKAVGASNFTVGLSAITQIVTTNAIGVLIGAVGTILLVSNFPETVPIMLTGQAAIAAIISLMLIGPLGGIVSVFALLRIEPLTALGLAQ
jgi:putative ABC transport system permease protein